MIQVHKQNENRWLVFNTKSDDTCYIVRGFAQAMGEQISFFRVDNADGITIATQLESYVEAKETAMKLLL